MTYERVSDEKIDKKYLCSPKYEAHCDEWPQAYVYAFHWSIIKMNHWAYPHPYTLVSCQWCISYMLYKLPLSARACRQRTSFPSTYPLSFSQLIRFSSV